MTRFKLKITHGLSSYPDIIKITSDPKKALHFLECEVSPYTRGFTKIVTTENKQYVKSIAENDCEAFRYDHVPYNQFEIIWQKCLTFVLHKFK